MAIEPDSYVRPHCHLDPNKSETIIPLRGRLGALVFDGEGKVLEARVIAPEAGSFGFHVPAGVFHSIVALESGTVAAIGKPTAEELARLGVRVSIMPEKFTFEAMLQALKETTTKMSK